MKKIAIVTNILCWNFGNRLQNYATQELLKEFDVYPETLRASNAISERIKEFLRIYLLKGLTTKYRLFNRNIQWSKYALHGAVPPPDEYDFFLVGSDQVWNTIEFNDDNKNMALLAFVPPEKRLCLAPSFGVSQLPDRWKPFFKEQLSKFPTLSVREDAGANIIKELTGRKAEVLIDPTCMFDKEFWKKKEQCPRGISTQQPYILTYFLSGRTERINNDIESYAKTYGLEVYHLFDPLQKKALANAGPGEFLYLLSRASLVLTDSFHASVFSFLYQKPFVVYDREERNEKTSEMSRMDTFFSKFDLHRKFADSTLPNELFECNYQTGFARLQTERERVRTYLRKSLKI